MQVPMNELALFAGAGGGILAGQLLGWRTVCAVELDPYAASVLVARQDDGLLPPFPIWDDVRSFDGRPWRGRVDVVSGGFPCQDISLAGRGAGIYGARSGLWSEFARILLEVRPNHAFIENSPALVARGLDRVLSDLAALGFDAEWGVLGASDVGAPHRRERIWILAHAIGIGRSEGRSESAWREGGPETAERCADVANPDRARELQPRGPERDERRWVGDGGCAKAVSDAAGKGCTQQGRASEALPGARAGEPAGPDGCGWHPWVAEPDVGRVAHGVAARVDRLKALGNGQVPQCAAEAWRLLSGRLGMRAHP